MTARHRQFAGRSFLLIAGVGAMLVLATLMTLVQALPVVRQAARALGTEVAERCGCAAAAALGTTSMALGLTLFIIGGIFLLGMMWRALMLFMKTRTFSSSFSVRQPYGKLHAVASTLGLEGRVLEIGGQQRDVFCAGLIRPRLYVASGAVEALGPEELRAVLEHERFHLERRDPLRMLVADLVLWFVRFIPGLKRMYQEFRTSVELAADEAAIERLGNIDHLSRALLRLLPSPSAVPKTVPVGVTYFGATDRRIENLLGQHQPHSRWMLVVLALVGLAALLAVGLSGWRIRTITAAAKETTIVQCRQVQHSCQQPPTFFPTGMSTAATLTSAP